MGTNNKNKGKHSAQEHADSLYRDIVISTNTLIWRTDAEGRFTFLNPAWERNYGYSSEEMLGRPFSEFQVSEAAEHYINAFRNCMIGEAVIGHETTFYAKDGSEVFLAINMIPLLNESGKVSGIQGTAFDVTERKHADELLQYISSKDELTGLYNLHTFMSMTEQQIKTANREKKLLLIICAGVSGMEAINADHGRETGDRVLMDTANIFRKTFREADILARTGGDEFVISTLVASRDGKDLIMVRLKDNIGKYNAGRGSAPAISLSIGTASYDPAENITIEEVLSRADDRMHANKVSRKTE